MSDSQATIDRIPHRPPARIVERFLGADETEAKASFVVRHGPWLRGGAFAPEALVEALAQTTALYVAANTPPEIQIAGVLAAVSHFACASRALPGEEVHLTVRLQTRLGPLAAFEGVARVGDREVARGDLRVAIK